jgi:hypothetical protein
MEIKNNVGLICREKELKLEWIVEGRGVERMLKKGVGRILGNGSVYESVGGDKGRRIDRRRMMGGGRRVDEWLMNEGRLFLGVGVGKIYGE